MLTDVRGVRQERAFGLWNCPSSENSGKRVFNGLGSALVGGALSVVDNFHFLSYFVVGLSWFRGGGVRVA